MSLPRIRHRRWRSRFAAGQPVGLGIDYQLGQWVQMLLMMVSVVLVLRGRTVVDFPRLAFAGRLADVHYGRLDRIDHHGSKKITRWHRTQTAAFGISVTATATAARSTLTAGLESLRFGRSRRFGCRSRRRRRRRSLEVETLRREIHRAPFTSEESGQTGRGRRG